MTIQELKRLLANYPDNILVVVSGYEGGYDDVSVVKPIMLIRNAHHEDYYGQHERDYDQDKNAIPALFLAGYNQLAKGSD